MNHLAWYFAALYVSDAWYTGWLIKPKTRISWKARAIVLYDRVLTGRIEAEWEWVKK